MNRTGFYCQDCDKIMDSSAYGYHNSDHTMKAIVWDFLDDTQKILAKERNQK